ncbi:IMPACT family protein [Methyloradius palustris]|uniref:YigZ family protein n=1 Tax=Methyloradius palustris TaxID=2778876 RepID=A0A8D5GAY2_9PROT|nr:YigZ family protein [Methyloradius palustris]BCM24916.1 YigZ family protein [Methyloradius palustris]
MQRITQSGQAEQTINKSRFIAAADYCDSERMVGLALRRLASGHAGAHHLAYAFRIKTDQGIVQRFHDAGEPSGTAGKPILQLLEGRDLVNVCVGVIRYYGGINLGTGGLARAYGGTAKLALENAHHAPYVEMSNITLKMDYSRFDEFCRELGKLNGEVLDKQFGQHVEVIASLPASQISLVMQRFAIA